VARCLREDGAVSKTVAVEFRGRAFWAFDVSEFITASEAARLEIEPGITVLWRPADAVPTEPIVGLSKALAALDRGACPTRPPATGGSSGSTVTGGSSACATTRAASRTNGRR
jgi:hypothetical protein